MYILNYAQSLGAAALLAIITLTVAALVSLKIRAYTRSHPWRYAAIALLLTVSAVMAGKPPVEPEPWPTAVWLKLLRKADNSTSNVLRPVDFDVEVR